MLTFSHQNRIPVYIEKYSNHMKKKEQVGYRKNTCAAILFWTLLLHFSLMSSSWKKRKTPALSSCSHFSVQLSPIFLLTPLFSCSEISPSLTTTMTRWWCPWPCVHACSSQHLKKLVLPTPPRCCQLSRGWYENSAPKITKKTIPKWGSTDMPLFSRDHKCNEWIIDTWEMNGMK